MFSKPMASASNVWWHEISSTAASWGQDTGRSVRMLAQRLPWMQAQSQLWSIYGRLFATRWALPETLAVMSVADYAADSKT